MTARKWLCALAVLGALVSVPAGAVEVIEKQKLSIANWASSVTAVTQPITVHSNNSITTPVYINRKGPFEFLVDTGAFWSGIKRSTVVANDLAYKQVDRIDIIGADGRSSVKVLQFESLITAGFIMKRKRLLELGSGPLGVPSVKRGILGTDFLANHIVAFDLQASRIILYPKVVDLDKELPGRFDIIPMKYSRKRNGIHSTVKLNGKRFRALVDTGASLTIVNERLAERLGIDTKRGYRGHGTGINGGRIEVYRTKLESLEAGTRIWKNINIGLIKMPRSGGSHDAVLGMDLLGKQPFAVDYAHNRLLILKPETGG